MPRVGGFQSNMYALSFGFYNAFMLHARLDLVGGWLLNKSKYTNKLRSRVNYTSRSIFADKCPYIRVDT